VVPCISEDFQGRHVAAFEAKDFAALGEVGIPSDIVVEASLARGSFLGAVLGIFSHRILIFSNFFSGDSALTVEAEFFPFLIIPQGFHMDHDVVDLG
jgi:hypothetical protein